MLPLSNKITTTPGPDIVTTCPACKASATVATVNLKETGNLLFVIPVFLSRRTIIRCGACEVSFEVPGHTDRLTKMTPEQLAEYLENAFTDIPLFAKICIIISILFGCVPYVGLGCALIGVAFAFRRSYYGWRNLAFLGLVISVTVSWLFFFYAR